MFIEFTEVFTKRLVSALITNILQVEKYEDGTAVIFFREPVRYGKSRFVFFRYFTVESYEEIMSRINNLIVK